MDFTYQDYFNYYLKEFCFEITANFPNFEKSIVENYRELLENKNNKNDLYAKYFITKINEYMEDVCNKNTELFIPKRWFNTDTNIQCGLYLLEGVDFIKLWNSDHNTEENKQAIWKYLQLLILLGRKIIPNKVEIDDILNNVGGEIYAPTKVEKTLKFNKDDDLDDVGNKPDIFGLGNIASLAGLMGIGSGEAPNLTDIVKNIGEVFGNINMDEIAKQMEKAQQQAESNLNPHKHNNNDSDNDSTNDSDNDNNNNSTNDSDNDNNNDSTNDSDNDNTENSNTENSNTGNSNNENSNTGNSNTENTKSKNKSKNKSKKTENENLTSNTTNLFSDLAKEMTETFDFSNLENDKPENMGDVISKFFSGDNPSKLMGLVTKFGSEMQKNVKNGNINQADLMRDTQKMMSGFQSGDKTNIKKQAEQLAKENPQLAQQMKKMQSDKTKYDRSGNGDIRERMRSKLAEKQKNT